MKQTPQDVSHNRLTTIEPILLQFPNLQILYMHGNEIAKLKEGAGDDATAKSTVELDYTRYFIGSNRAPRGAGTAPGA